MRILKHRAVEIKNNPFHRTARLFIFCDFDIYILLVMNLNIFHDFIIRNQIVHIVQVIEHVKIFPVEFLLSASKISSANYSARFGELPFFNAVRRNLIIMYAVGADESLRKIEFLQIAVHDGADEGTGIFRKSPPIRMVSAVSPCFKISNTG